MFFTGYSRAADQVLDEQRTKSTAGDTAMIDNLHFVKELGPAQPGRARAGRRARASPP